MSESNTSELPNDLSALDVHSGIDAVDSRLNKAQMLSLIDSIFPFEACLYHEIIPLSVESSCLHLGMVNPTDSVAVDYARRQASFIHCSIVPWSVSSDWQRKMLSKYLGHASRQPTKPATAPALTTHPLTPGELNTFIIDSPEDLHGDLPPRPTPPAPAPIPTPISNSNTQPLNIELDPALGQVTIQQLHQLPPAQLAQALLIRVMTEGIGRLFFERDQVQGRILWSQDGVVQAVLHPLTLAQFQSILNEFKRLVHLPLLPTTQTKQADIERLYNGERVMLRLRLIPGAQGEEGTLQVLRGAALKFYQKQKIKQLGEDALGVAHTLQKRISAIREQARQTVELEAPSSQALESLSLLLKTMEEQIQQIMQSPPPPNG